MSILSQDWTTEKWADVVKALVRLLHKSAKKDALNVKIYKKNTSCQILNLRLMAKLTIKRATASPEQDPARNIGKWLIEWEICQP